MAPDATVPQAGMLYALRYYWITAKGYRLRPWASPYVRWRMETFFGGDMHALGAREFFGLMWRERGRFARFLAWAAERRAAQAARDEEAKRTG